MLILLFPIILADYLTYNYYTFGNTIRSDEGCSSLYTGYGFCILGTEVWCTTYAYDQKGFQDGSYIGPYPPTFCYPVIDLKNIPYARAWESGTYKFYPQSIIQTVGQDTVGLIYKGCFSYHKEKKSEESTTTYIHSFSPLSYGVIGKDICYCSGPKIIGANSEKLETAECGRFCFDYDLLARGRIMTVSKKEAICPLPTFSIKEICTGGSCKSKGDISRAEYSFYQQAITFAVECYLKSNGISKLPNCVVSGDKVTIHINSPFPFIHYWNLISGATGTSWPDILSTSIDSWVIHVVCAGGNINYEEENNGCQTWLSTVNETYQKEKENDEVCEIDGDIYYTVVSIIYCESADATLEFSDKGDYVEITDNSVIFNFKCRSQTAIVKYWIGTGGSWEVLKIYSIGGGSTTSGDEVQVYLDSTRVANKTDCNQFYGKVIEIEPEEIIVPGFEEKIYPSESNELNELGLPKTFRFGLINSNTTTFNLSLVKIDDFSEGIIEMSLYNAENIENLNECLDGKCKPDVSYTLAYTPEFSPYENVTGPIALSLKIIANSICKMNNVSPVYPELEKLKENIFSDVYISASYSTSSVFNVQLFDKITGTSESFIVSNDDTAINGVESFVNKSLNFFANYTKKYRVIKVSVFREVEIPKRPYPLIIKFKNKGDGSAGIFFYGQIDGNEYYTGQNCYWVKKGSIITSPAIEVKGGEEFYVVCNVNNSGKMYFGIYIADTGDHTLDINGNGFSFIIEGNDLIEKDVSDVLVAGFTILRSIEPKLNLFLKIDRFNSTISSDEKIFVFANKNSKFLNIFSVGSKGNITNYINVFVYSPISMLFRINTSPNCLFNVYSNHEIIESLKNYAEVEMSKGFIVEAFCIGGGEVSINDSLYFGPVSQNAICMESCEEKEFFVETLFCYSVTSSTTQTKCFETLEECEGNRSVDAELCRLSGCSVSECFPKYTYKNFSVGNKFFINFSGGYIFACSLKKNTCKFLILFPIKYKVEHNLTLDLWVHVYVPIPTYPKIYLFNYSGRIFMYPALFPGCGDGFCNPFRGERCYHSMCPECSPENINLQWGFADYYPRENNVEGNERSLCYCPTDLSQEYCPVEARDIFGCVKIREINEPAEAPCQCDWKDLVLTTAKEKHYCCPENAQIDFDNDRKGIVVLAPDDRLYIPNSHCGNITIQLRKLGWVGKVEDGKIVIKLAEVYEKDYCDWLWVGKEVSEMIDNFVSWLSSIFGSSPSGPPLDLYDVIQNISVTYNYSYWYYDPSSESFIKESVQDEKILPISSVESCECINPEPIVEEIVIPGDCCLGPACWDRVILRTRYVKCETLYCKNILFHHDLLKAVKTLGGTAEAKPRVYIYPLSSPNVAKCGYNYTISVGRTTTCTINFTHAPPVGYE